MGCSDYDKIKTSMDFFRLKNNKFVLWRLLRTPELDDFWNEFIEKHPELRAEFDEAIRICDSVRINDCEYTGAGALSVRIQDTLATKQRHARVLRLSRIAAVAAVFLLLFVPALYFGYVHYMRQPVQVSYTPSGSHTGSDDRQLELMRQSKNVELLVDGRRITFSHLRALSVKDGRVICGGTNSVAGKICRLFVPAGKRFAVTLPDGTRLWVNSRTEAEIPTRFDGATREVHIDGEIFADVRKNPQQPFIVHTNRMDVTVKGTSFDVSAYGHAKETSVVLVTGKVLVDTRKNGSMMIAPNERASLSGGQLSKRTVDVSDYVSWKDDYLSLNDTPVREVLRKVSASYDIRFADGDADIYDKRISGKLYLSDRIDDVLSSIALLTSSTYTRENNMVKFVRKGRRQSL